MFSGSKYPKNILCNFEKGSTAHNDMVTDFRRHTNMATTFRRQTDMVTKNPRHTTWL